MKFSKLDNLYKDANDRDEELFYEQKSNVLLDNGKHYTSVKKRNDKIRKSSLEEGYKIRLTKNHINKIVNVYVNSIVSRNPGVTFEPSNSDELQDKKDAQLSNAVWDNIRVSTQFEKTLKKIVKRFIVIGEAWVKINYNNNKGSIIGYEGKIEEVSVTNEDGETVTVEQQTIDKTKPVRDGAFEFDVIDGYNVFVDASATSVDDARFIGLKKLINKENLIEILEQYYEGKELKEKIEAVESSNDREENGYYPSLDIVSGGYREDHDKVFIREFYFKASPKYPNGKFVMICDKAILVETDLMKDLQGDVIFPIKYAQCTEAIGSVRGYSIIKQLRPLQAEVNRAASKIAEIQAIHGDDKVLTQVGQSLKEGQKIGGVREYKVKGGLDPKWLPGRNGEQFFQYLDSIIKEMYFIAGIPEFVADKRSGEDVLAGLYKSLKEKSTFTLYSDEVERLLVNIVETSLRIAKVEYRDEKVIKAVGKSEFISIPEFRETNDMHYSIKAKPMSEDIDSVMGKYLQTRDLIQYSGSQFTPEQIGTIAKDGMPFLKEDVFRNIIDNVDIIEQMLLQMDRGENPMISEYDDNEAIIKAITNRMKRTDFMYVASKNPIVAQVYQYQYETRSKILQQTMMELKEANLGIIPTGEGKIKVDIYKSDDRGNAERVAVPEDAMKWFIERLSKQGAITSEMGELSPQAQADIYGQLQNVVGQGGGSPQQNLAGRAE